MNWYRVFYWISVSDSVKSFFDTFSNIFTFLSVVAFIVYILIFIQRNTDDYKQSTETERKSLDVWFKSVRSLFIAFTFLTVITWAGYVFTPSKRDALIIVGAGGALTYLAKDSSARRLPPEFFEMLREKLKAEIRDAKLDNIIDTDTLKNKTKEELLDILRKQTK